MVTTSSAIREAIRAGAGQGIVFASPECRGIGYGPSSTVQSSSGFLRYLIIEERTWSGRGAMFSPDFRRIGNRRH